MQAHEIPAWVEQVKFLASAGAFFWGAFKVYTYIKDALTNTQTGVDAIRVELKDQTQAIVKAADIQTNELRTMSSDVKVLVQTMITPAPRARRRRPK